MSKQTLQNQLECSFHQFNRFLTLGLTVSIILVSVILWYLGYASIDSHSTIIGLILMGLAVIFYKLPHISYWCTRIRYRSDEGASKMLSSGWKEFRNMLEKS